MSQWVSYCNNKEKTKEVIVVCIRVETAAPHELDPVFPPFCCLSLSRADYCKCNISCEGEKVGGGERPKLLQIETVANQRKPNCSFHPPLAFWLVVNFISINNFTLLLFFFPQIILIAINLCLPPNKSDSTASCEHQCGDRTSMACPELRLRHHVEFCQTLD